MLSRKTWPVTTLLESLCVLIVHSRILSAIIVHHDETPQNSAQLGLFGTCQSKRQGRGTSPFPINSSLPVCVATSTTWAGEQMQQNEQTTHLHCENKEVQRGHTSLTHIPLISYPFTPYTLPPVSHKELNTTKIHN